MTRISRRKFLRRTRVGVILLAMTILCACGNGGTSSSSTPLAHIDPCAPLPPAADPNFLVRPGTSRKSRIAVAPFDRIYARVGLHDFFSRIQIHGSTKVTARIYREGGKDLKLRVFFAGKEAGLTGGRHLERRNVCEVRFPQASYCGGAARLRRAAETPGQGLSPAP
jgi:hypothetical protein